jgi:hypothetical protein
MGDSGASGAKEFRRGGGQVASSARDIEVEEEAHAMLHNLTVPSTCGRYPLVG